MPGPTIFFFLVQCFKLVSPGGDVFFQVFEHPGEEWFGFLRHAEFKQGGIRFGHFLLLRHGCEITVSGTVRGLRREDNPVRDEMGYAKTNVLRSSTVVTCTR